MVRPAPGRPRDDQRWSTFLRNHAQAIVACDFFVAIAATFRQIYVFVVMHPSSRTLLHFNVTKQPDGRLDTAALRQTFGPDDAFHYLLHDRDSIFSEGLNRSIEAFGLRVLKSPPRSPKANALCERLIGTIRRECLDWLIPLSEQHLRSLLKTWAVHYNRSRPIWDWGRAYPIRPCRPPGQTSSEAGIDSMPVLTYASNRYSVAFTMSTIGRRRAFEFNCCAPQV